MTYHLFICPFIVLWINNSSMISPITLLNYYKFYVQIVSFIINSWLQIQNQVLCVSRIRHHPEPTCSRTMMLGIITLNHYLFDHNYWKKEIVQTPNEPRIDSGKNQNIITSWEGPLRATLKIRDQIHDQSNL